MKYTRYSKYAPNAADDIDLQELMSRLSDFLLQSGFQSQYGIYEMDPDRSREQMMEELREAILRALHEGDLLSPEMMEQLLNNPDMVQNQELRDVVDQIIQRMEQEGFISRPDQPVQVTPPPSETPGGQVGEAQPNLEGPPRYRPRRTGSDPAYGLPPAGRPVRRRPRNGGRTGERAGDWPPAVPIETATTPSRAGLEGPAREIRPDPEPVGRPRPN